LIMKNKNVMYAIAAGILITSLLSASEPANDSLSISPDKTNPVDSVISLSDSNGSSDGSSGDYSGGSADASGGSGSDNDQDSKSKEGFGSADFSFPGDNNPSAGDESFEITSNLHNFDNDKKPTLEWVQEFVKNNGLLISSVTVGLIFTGLYKYHKPFKKNIDEKYAKLQAFWEDQHKKPVTWGFMAKVSAGVGLLYFVHKARLDTIITSSARHLYKYYQDLTLSEKCIVGAGLATSTVALPWLYNKIYAVPDQNPKKQIKK